MTLRIEDWGFTTAEDGALMVGGCAARSLASEYGTPLQVIDELGLTRRARRVRDAFAAAYPGETVTYFAMKANNTPSVARMVFDQGLEPEVGTPYEWQLARRLGKAPRTIIVNGPNKGPLLDMATQEGAPAGLIVVDGPQELAALSSRCRHSGRRARTLLRINPNVVPRGMNRASATGSRKHSVFGFDTGSGEVASALDSLARSADLEFAGFHCHVGTGIRQSRDYVRPLEIVFDYAALAAQLGLETRVVDIGGGFGVPTSRELDTIEFLLYQALGRLPKPPNPNRFPLIEDFAATVAQTITRECGRRGLDLPRLVIEPGRSIVSGAGLLLLTVGALKPRNGVGTWVVTDGAAGTVAFPLFYEYHEVFLTRAPHAERDRLYTLVGPVCFSADWIYRNKRMPRIEPGDVLAVCDAGAYFTVQESNFGFPRPAIVAVRDGRARLLRRRETFEDMVSRDIGWVDTRGEQHAA
ncbi:MAG: hypothetical protein JSW71_21700 [Gemmatimonadota bacterium]|nr:MAG: hypothetical protein JSW71_21700 [Gemmatimonadota bacterium]